MWLLFAVAALAAPAAPAPADPTGPEPAAGAAPNALAAVVLVELGDATCAGAVVSPEGQVATAYHCVASGGRPRVVTRDQGVHRARIVAVDRAADLALLSVPDLAGADWMATAAEPPPVGAEVRAMGHPFGAAAPFGFMEGTLRWSVTRGVVSGVGPRAVQFDAPVNPGNSGGPVVDDEGRLVAVVSRKARDGEGLGFGARPEHLTALRDRPPRGMSPFGGTVSLLLAGGMLEDRGGAASVGPRLEIALRDRVVFAGAWHLPVSARWDAVRFGEVRWLGPEARVGVRQRLFRGPFTTRLDVFAGVGGLTRLEGAVGEGSVELRRSSSRALLAGAAVRVGFAGLEVAVTDDRVPRVSAVVAWPGRIGIF